MAATPQRELRDAILTALSANESGSLTYAEVIRDLDERFRDRWTPEDHVEYGSTPSVPRWEVNARSERQRMVDEGLLTNAVRGVWTLTSAGRRAADELRSGVGAPSNHATVASGWDLRPGDKLNRAERMARFGGGRQGGIEPSTRTPNVFVYSDPKAGAAFGYHYDGWNADGTVFLYTGEGGSGDQQLTSGNKAIAEHSERGNALRVFVADGTEPGSGTRRQLYVGEFRIDDALPFIRAEAPGVDGLMRSVLVFRLRPIGDVLRRPEDVSNTGDVGGEPRAEAESAEALPAEAIAASVPLETLESPSFQFTGSAPGVAVRREADLVARFKLHLKHAGHKLDRYKLKPAGELRHLYTDIYDHTDNVLYEAKATATRDAVRMAVGQLLDYRRHVPGDPQLAVLLPSRPADDLIAFLESLQIRCVYATGKSTFEHHPSAPPLP
jgi:hypothetical protein